MDLNTLKVMNFDKICRICFLPVDMQHSNLIHGNITIEEVGESFSIPYLLGEVTSKEMDMKNILPQRICWKCVELIKSAYILKISYLKSSEVLEEYLNDLATKLDANKDTESQVSEIIGDAGIESDNEQNSQKEKVLHTCPICLKELSALTLRKHIQTKHTDLKGYLKAAPKANKTSRFYTENRKTIDYYSANPIMHKCHFCQEYLEADDFLIHIVEHDKPENLNKSCEICHRVFNSYRALRVHLTSHIKERPYKCKICKKSFSLKRNLIHHSNVHTKASPYQCNVCHVNFYSPVYLRRHIRAHAFGKTPHCARKVTFEQATEDEPEKLAKIEAFKRKLYKKSYKNILCTICGKYTHNLKYHMLSHTGEKKFSCHICGKSFSLNATLQKHIKTHDEARLFVCSICGNTFKNKNGLDAHLKIHIGDKCHICPICDKGFLVRGYLNKHLRTVHAHLNETEKRLE